MPEYLVYSYTCLGVGLILLTSSTAIMYKIYNGSKSTFAYVLLIFTFGYGLDYTLVFLE